MPFATGPNIFPDSNTSVNEAGHLEGCENPWDCGGLSFSLDSCALLIIDNRQHRLCIIQDEKDSADHALEAHRAQWSAGCAQMFSPDG